MVDRAVPPSDISPVDFFTRWIPESVEQDLSRQKRLGATEATLEFELLGEGGGTFTLQLSGGAVRGCVGSAEQPDLRIRLDLDTWRALNSRELSAPEAFLRRRVRLEGNLVLALKLHLIVG